MYINPLESFISYLTPLRCNLCQNEADMLCDECIQTIFAELDSRCYKCNKMTKQSQVCTACRSNSRLRRVWWMGNYHSAVKELVRSMKFGRKRAYARQFGMLLDNALPFVPEDTIVVPIPTANSRVRRRGFDQAALIAESFARARHLEFKRILQRTSEVDQIGKNRKERMRQMEGSLKVRSSNSSIADRSVLLIDDVITTGATVESAAKLLRENGVKHVDAAAVARHLLG